MKHGRDIIQNMDKQKLNQTKTLSVAQSVVLFVVLMVCGITGCSAQNKRRVSKFFIPSGYIGYIDVKYGVKGAHPLPVSNGSHVLKVPQSGILKTSTAMEEGYAVDEYYYDAGTTRTHLISTPTSNRMIWDISNGMNSEEPDVDILRFFVGSYRDSQLVSNTSDVHRVYPSILRIRLKGRKMTYKNLIGRDFSGMNLVGADFSSSTLQNARFRKANLSYAVLQANLRRTDLRGANLQYADLRGASLENADARGADFRNADLSGAILRGVKYDRLTRWPKGISVKQIQNRIAKWN